MKKLLCKLALSAVLITGFSAAGFPASAAFAASETSGEVEKIKGTVVTTHEKNEDKTMPTGNACTDETGDDNGSWAIYWYICASNLESRGGCATDNLKELMKVDLPENVNFVIETGGTTEWKDEKFSADKIQRWVYNSEDFTLVDEQPQSDMGEGETLESFLSYAYENYPADKIAVIIWDHGAGSLYGTCNDDNYEDSALTMDEMYQAFCNVWTPDVDHPPLEMVGFDACLMSTIDTAYNFCDLAHYLVASEDSEPGDGWNYCDWGKALAENPGMKGLELGKVICDTYMQRCEECGTAEEATLALTDLNKIGPLVDTYQNLGEEFLLQAAGDKGFAAHLAQKAYSSENYGGNTWTEKFYNMVDLGDLMSQLPEVESSQLIEDQLDECVVYRVNGSARQQGRGLSFYYSYNGDIDEMDCYQDYLVLEDDLASFYKYTATGKLDRNGKEILYANNLNPEEMPEIINIEDTDWPGIDPEIDDDGNVSVTLGSEAADCLTGVYYSFYGFLKDEDIMVCLGTDNTLNYDWDNGVFSRQLAASWGMIDGHPVYMAITNYCDDYDLYAVPILLNGDYRTLKVMYDYDEGWKILGACTTQDDDGFAGKDLTPLNVGDEITTVWSTCSISNPDDELELTKADTFTVTEDTSFAFGPIGDGAYAVTYRMMDLSHRSVYSKPVFFICENDMISVTDRESVTGEADRSITAGETDSDSEPGETDSNSATGETDSDSEPGETDSDSAAGETDSHSVTGQIEEPEEYEATVTLINDTDTDITEMYLVSEEENVWGTELFQNGALETEVLKAGNQATLNGTLTYNSDASFALKLKTGEKRVAEFRDINFADREDPEHIIITIIEEDGCFYINY